MYRVSSSLMLHIYYRTVSLLSSSQARIGRIPIRVHFWSLLCGRHADDDGNRISDEKARYCGTIRCETYTVKPYNILVYIKSNKNE